MIVPPESLKFCAHYSRLEIEQLRAPTRAALISIRDPGSSRPGYSIEHWPDLLELEFHDITSDEPRDELWWQSWAKDGYLVPCRENAISICQFVRRHWEKSIIVHCEMGLSRSAAVCEVLVGLGWAYQSTRPDGRRRANRRLVQLLQEEFALPAR
jgi:predicted protein tyrosine phosphatase